MVGRHGDLVALSEADKGLLESQVHRHKAPGFSPGQCQMILLCAQALQSKTFPNAWPFTSIRLANTAVALKRMKFKVLKTSSGQIAPEPFPRPRLLKLASARGTSHRRMPCTGPSARWQLIAGFRTQQAEGYGDPLACNRIMSGHSSLPPALSTIFF